MFILTIITWLSYVLSFAFGLLCFSQGLYYIADLVEEHGTLAKKVLKLMLYTIIGVHVSMLIFESDIPWFEVFVGIAAHVTYITLLPHFPFIDLTSPKAIFAGIMALINHFAWFYHMVNYAYYSYGEIIAIFVICVWACPLAFVISLSTTEQLPYGAEVEGAERRKGSNRIANLFRMLKRKQEELLPSSTPKTL